MEHDGRKEEYENQHSEEQTKQVATEQEQILLELNTEAGLNAAEANVQTEIQAFVAMDEDIKDPGDDVVPEESETSSIDPEEEEPVALSELELNELIESICTSKAEEFRMIGYEHVTGREIWECVSDKYQKTGMPALHQIVNDILSLKVTKFMNWMTMSIYKSNPFA
ncbi:post-transcriptional regulator [Paenibacillus sp. 1_12]|uniref:post-transcriptional regulator n=1 Tax=Paenibacillus sp. 1_12 TaxID=1566278 RepID=UPI0035279691